MKVRMVRRPMAILEASGATASDGKRVGVRRPFRRADQA
jgi:hypothetical protein